MLKYMKPEIDSLKGMQAEPLPCNKTIRTWR